MPIRFACPHCGVETDVADTYAGRTGPCANCGRTVTVAAAAPVVGGSASKGSSGLLLVALAAGGVLVVILLCGAILMARLLPAAQSARQTAHQNQCASNLRQIATAVFSYRQRYDTFPPPYIADKDGRPKHSWRVLILPFLGQRALYDRYNFDQPWDGPDNLALMDMTPPVYRCPAAPDAASPQTSYVMLVGPDSFSSVTGPRRLGEFRDGAVNTIMLVESVDSGIIWTQPRDFDVGQMPLQINAPAGGGISSPHPGGAHAAMCDGSVRLLSEWTLPEEVRAMTTVSGGETVTPSR